MKPHRASGILATSSFLLCACTSWELDHCPSLIESDGTIDLPQIQATMGADIPAALRGPVYQTARPHASQQAIDDDALQRNACHAYQGLRHGPKRDEKQSVFANAQLNVYADGLKGNLKPEATAAAAILQAPPATTPAPAGWYGFTLSSNINSDVELRSKVGNFSRLPGTGTFSQLCSSVGLACVKVTDREGHPQSCDENPNDGSRLAYCQSRV